MTEQVPVYSAVIGIPADATEWKKILKNPAKFLAKSVQKGVEISYHKLNAEQKKAMDVAKAAEVQAWIGSKVARAANINVPPDEALKMRCVYTFKSVPDDPTKIKAKARLVVLGFSEPSLLERDTSCPALTRTSKMLLLNLASAKRWITMAGDVRAAFLQAIRRKTEFIHSSLVPFLSSQKPCSSRPNRCWSCWDRHMV